MNKVQQLQDKLNKTRDKVYAQIKKIQGKCKHKNTQRWSDYSGISEQCKDCEHWLRG